MDVDIDKMEQDGTIDYYLALRKYIRDFANKNYSITDKQTEKEFWGLVNGCPSENALKRQKALKILEDTLSEGLKNITQSKVDMINNAESGNLTQFTTQDLEKEIFETKQKMLENLWNSREQSEQFQTKQNNIADSQDNIEQDKGEITEQCEHSQIREDKLNENHDEIMQAGEKEVILESSNSEEMIQEVVDQDVKFDIDEMEQNGTIDYYLDLKKYISDFVNKNYPLTKEDFDSILKDCPSENVLKRQETIKILEGTMNESLKNIAQNNMDIINKAESRDFTQFATQDVEKEIFEIKQKMLEKLWDSREQSEQLQTKQNDIAESQDNIEQDNSEITEQCEHPQIQENQLAENHDEIIQAGEKEATLESYNSEEMIQEVVDQSVELDIGMDEIDEIGREINSIEIGNIEMEQVFQLGV